MSEKNMEDVKENVVADNPPQNRDHCEKSEEKVPGPDEKEENLMPSPQQEVCDSIVCACHFVVIWEF